MITATDRTKPFLSAAIIALTQLAIPVLAPAPVNETTAPSQLWQTGFTYLKVIGWGWFYLCTAQDDFSHHVIACRVAPA